MHSLIRSTAEGDTQLSLTDQHNYCNIALCHLGVLGSLGAPSRAGGGWPLQPKHIHPLSQNLFSLRIFIARGREWETNLNL